VRAACRDENLTVKQTHDLLRGTVEEFHRKFEQRIGNAAALMKVAATERERLLKAKLRAAMADGTHDEMLLALARSPIADADAIAALARCGALGRSGFWSSDAAPQAATTRASRVSACNAPPWGLRLSRCERRIVDGFRSKTTRLPDSPAHCPPFAIPGGGGSRFEINRWRTPLRTSFAECFPRG